MSKFLTIREIEEMSVETFVVHRTIEQIKKLLESEEE